MEMPELRQLKKNYLLNVSCILPIIYMINASGNSLCVQITLFVVWELSIVLILADMLEVLPIHCEKKMYYGIYREQDIMWYM